MIMYYLSGKPMQDVFRYPYICWWYDYY